MFKYFEFQTKCSPVSEGFSIYIRDRKRGRWISSARTRVEDRFLFTKGIYHTTVPHSEQIGLVKPVGESGCCILSCDSKDPSAMKDISSYQTGPPLLPIVHWTQVIFPS